MSIDLAVGFNLSTSVPLDGRTVTATLVSLFDIPESKRYLGLTVHVTSTAKNYQLIGGLANTNWVDEVTQLELADNELSQLISMLTAGVAGGFDPGVIWYFDTLYSSPGVIALLAVCGPM